MGQLTLRSLQSVLQLKQRKCFEVSGVHKTRVFLRMAMV